MDNKKTNTTRVTLAILLTVALLVPDFLMAASGIVSVPHLALDSVIGIFLFSLLLVSTHRGMVYVAILFFAVFQLVQVGFLSYFRSPMEPPALYLAFAEGHEVKHGIAGEFLRYWPVLLYLLVPLLVFVFLHAWLHREEHKHPHAKWLLALIVMVLPVRIALLDNPSAYMPERSSPSILNTWKSQSLFLGRILPEVLQTPDAGRELNSYLVSKKNDYQGNRVVVLVVGESVNANRFSLVNQQHRETTPRLASFSKEFPLVAKEAWSAGVNTRGSVYTLLSGLRDPRDVHEWKTGDANLFRIARKAGYATHLISAQYPDMLESLDFSSIDDVVTQASRPGVYERRGDEMLLDELKERDLTGKHFVVVHMRVAHYPYADHYRLHPELARYKEMPSDHPQSADYDNALLYADYVLERLFRQLLAQAPGQLEVVYTADHSELFGENGFNGHTMMHPEGCKVPFVYWSRDAKDEAYPLASALHYPAAFDVSRFTAGLMGFSLQAKGHHADSDVVINGPLAHGAAGVLVLRRNSDGSLKDFYRTF